MQFIGKSILAALRKVAHRAAGRGGARDMTIAFESSVLKLHQTTRRHNRILCSERRWRSCSSLRQSRDLTHIGSLSRW